MGGGGELKTGFFLYGPNQCFIKKKVFFYILKIIQRAEIVRSESGPDSLYNFISFIVFVVLF